MCRMMPAQRDQLMVLCLRASRARMPFKPNIFTEIIALRDMSQFPDISLKFSQYDFQAPSLLTLVALSSKIF